MRNTNFSISLGKLFGIPTSIHWTFWILILWIVYSNMTAGQGGVATLWYVLFVFTIFACVVLHELGHALAARRYGIATKSIIILPIGGLASLEKIPEEPQQELVVAFAGPLVNIIIALLIYIFLSATGQSLLQLEGFTHITADNFLLSLFSVNLALVIFNLIPAFPMDGGRVFRALLALKMDRVKATEWAVNVGKVFSILFVFWGFSNNPFLVFIALFILMGAQAELAHVRSIDLFQGATIQDVLMKDYTLLSANSPIKTAVKILLNGQEQRFLVEENGLIKGLLTKTEIIQGLSTLGEQSPIAGVMQNKVLWLLPTTPLQAAREQMMKNGVVIAPIGENNVLKGILDLENLNEYLMVREAMKR